MGKVYVPSRSPIVRPVVGLGDRALTRKPTGALRPVDDLLPRGYASIATLNDFSDSLQHFGPGGNWGHIDRFANTAHSWRPDGPVIDGDSAAIRTSGSYVADGVDLTQWIWFRFDADYPSFSHAYIYFFYCNAYLSHSLRVGLSGAEDGDLMINDAIGTGRLDQWSANYNPHDGNWHLLAIERNAGRDGQAYYDGELVVWTTSGGLTSSDFLCFGGRDDSTSRYSNAQVGIAGYADRLFTPAEHRRLYQVGFDAYKPVPLAVIMPVVTAGTITGTGALAAQTSSVAGTGEVEHTGTGALTAQASVIAGTGTVSGVVTGTGAIAAQSSQVAGTGEITHTGTGDIDAQASSISGTGAVSGAVTGTGDLDAQVSSVSGTGVVTKTGFGDLDAQISVVSGTGTITKVGTGDLDAQASAISGTGAVTQTITGTGALVAGSSSIDGYDVLRIWTEIGDVTSTWTEITDTTSIWTEVT